MPPAAPQESTAEEPLVTPVLPPAAPSTDSSADSTVTPGDSVAEKETAPAPPDEQASPEAVLTAATGSLVEPVESEEPAVSEVVATKPAAPVEPVTAPPRITLRFTGNSWVDVRDSTRTFKLVGIMKAGTERTLGGKPPYNLVLGNAKGVALTIDGKPYDLAVHTRGNVARFTLEP
ncbi:MAG: DUF4115 domain-containing protein [Gammaproteobacteria bacterium]|nr:MAG: DUF4115 domain-containing protein [Gammaproteobacteria bacterium]